MSEERYPVRDYPFPDFSTSDAKKGMDPREHAKEMRENAEKHGKR